MAGPTNTSLWLRPASKQRLKTEAAKRGMTLTEYLQELADRHITELDTPAPPKSAPEPEEDNIAPYRRKLI